MTSIFRILPAATVALALGAGAAAAHERATGVIQSIDYADQNVTLNSGASFDLNGASRADARDFRPGQMVTFLFENGPNGNDVQRSFLRTNR